MSKSLNDIAYELTLMALEKDSNKTWTAQQTAESFRETHDHLLEELKKAYGTSDSYYLV